MFAQTISGTFFVRAGPRHRSPLLLSVTSYNVLAELYSSPHTYSYCPPCYSGWHYRKRSIVRELLSLPAEQHPGHAGPERPVRDNDFGCG